MESVREGNRKGKYASKGEVCCLCCGCDEIAMVLAVTGSGIKDPPNQLLFQTTKLRTHFGPLALHAQEPNVK
jgi:hypothetical protein